jgi:hypothetical protein
VNAPQATYKHRCAAMEVVRMRRWRPARSHFFHVGLLSLASGVFLAGAGCKAPTNNQTTRARSALETQENPPATVPVLDPGKKTPSRPRRATEEEVRARAALVNGGVAPAPPTAVDMELIFADASSKDPGRRVAALRRFHQAMRTLGTAGERKAAGERMRAIIALRGNESSSSRRAP